MSEKTKVFCPYSMPCDSSHCCRWYLSRFLVLARYDESHVL